MSKTIKLTEAGIKYMSDWIVPEHKSVDLEALRGNALSDDRFEFPVGWASGGFGNKIRYDWTLFEGEYEFVD